MTRVQGEPSADGKIRCIVWGCGQVGRDLIKTIGLGRTSVRIIGAVDDDPNKAVREIREVYPDEGDMDMQILIQTIKDVGYPHMVVRNHAPQHEAPWHTEQAFAFQFGFIKAMMLAVN